MKTLGCTLLLASVVLLTGSQQSGPPYDPKAALDTFRIADGFRIELFASEPLISDPVAMEVDEYGRTYVVEMHGYPLDVSGTGRVILLEDTDRDGAADRRTVFADGLRLPTGIMRWKKGVIVTDAPQILYLEDVDGDGRADVTRELLTGFALTNPQHNLNSPLYGLDNWIHVSSEGTVRTIRYQNAFGDQGSDVRFSDRPVSPRLPRNAGGRAVRFRPDTYELEALATRGQFGHTFDAWGRHFFSNNTRHLYQEVLEARYSSRNPDLIVPSVVEQLPDYRIPADVYPITQNPEFQLLTDIGVMTSACGVTAYLADLFPAAYRNATFVAEGAHNIVHVDTLRDHGVTFRASRMFDGREFLASTDSWFRPVNFYVGPDGALYVIDYYRKILEHPEWLDEKTATSPDLYAGRDRGRIYRIVPTGTPPASWTNRLNLGDLTAAELVRALASPNIWWRRTAQRLLVDRKPKEAAPLLAAMAANGSSAVARVHALWTLEGLRKLEARVIERALEDSAAGVRENATRLAELHLKDSPALAPRLLSMTGDADAKVRFQLLLTLGHLTTPEAAAARDDLLFRDVEDGWMQLAALSAANLDSVRLWRAAAERLSGSPSDARRLLFRRLGAVTAASRKLTALRGVLRAVASAAGPSAAWWRSATLEGLASGIPADRRRSAALNPERERLSGLVLGTEDQAVRRGALQVLETIGLPPGAAAMPVVNDAERIAEDAAANAEARVDAVRVLALHGVTSHEPLLRGIISRAEPAPVQVAAVRALSELKGPEIASAFLERWNRWTPAVRAEAVRALMREPARVRLLLDALTDGRVKGTEVDRPLRVRLMMQEQPELRARARELLGGPIGGRGGDTRAAVLTRYAPAASMPGNAERGEQVFARVCSTCHQYRGAHGAAYGPDLGEVRNRLPAALMLDILLPNHSIADRYEVWSVDLVDGTATGGVVASETGSSITVAQPGGAQTTIPRDRIQSMRVADISGMPEGLEDQIDPQQMADLIAFLKRGGAESLIPAGVAQIDITPDGPIRLSGYGSRTEPATEIKQRLTAKALAFGADGNHPAILITAELVGVTRQMSDEVARRLQKAGIERAQLVIAATHTHNGPVLTGSLPGIFGKPLPPDQQAAVDRHTARTVDAFERVALAALADRRPARIGWSAGRATFAANRRVIKDGKWTGFGVNPDGPVDHDLPVLTVRAPDGGLRAVLVSYACHGTTLEGKDNFIHGDWPGAAQLAIEQRHPGAIAMVTIGAAADANPHPRGGGLPDVERHATAVADEVDRLLAGPFRPLTAPPDGRLQWIELSFAGEKVLPTVAYPIQAWTFGRDLTMIFLGGEVVAEYGLRLKKELDASRLWVNAYANDVAFYVASRRMIPEGGYEVERSMDYYGQPARLADGTETRILDAVRALVTSSASGSASRARAGASPSASRVP
ncbi:MAG TPA: neutral/alkaline non-lysosomal ceramidase N-terminal domain-containing protein [Vicinamibacterales bacterium]|nr:neutral/alkaline non-lysosomal ceramidase N-terminal domain-containing protein [Vicinamibacterales bacterium]